MSDFEAKMHQIRSRLGSATDPAGGAYSVPPDTLAGFKGAASRQGGGKERNPEREGRGMGGTGTGGEDGREKRGRDGLRQNEKRKMTVAPLVYRFSFFLNLATGIKTENGLMA